MALAHEAAVEQVAHQRLGADEELVRQRVAGAGVDPPGPQQRAQAVLHLGPDLQVVLEQDRLPVEREPVLGPGLERGDDLVDDLDQVDAEVLEGQVPLAVPVRVRHEPQAPGPGVEQGRLEHGQNAIGARSRTTR